VKIQECVKKERYSASIYLEKYLLLRKNTRILRSQKIYRQKSFEKYKVHQNVSKMKQLALHDHFSLDGIAIFRRAPVPPYLPWPVNSLNTPTSHIQACPNLTSQPQIVIFWGKKT
jgi:hypothetical protein